MKFEKDRIKAKFTEISKKSAEFAVAAAKWVSEISVIVYDILTAYSIIKLKESRVKYDILKLGQEAYNQWENNKFFSLQDSLNKIKMSKTLISNKQAFIKTKIDRLKSLFDFKSEESIFYKHPKPETVSVPLKPEPQKAGDSGEADTEPEAKITPEPTVSVIERDEPAKDTTGGENSVQAENTENISENKPEDMPTEPLPEETAAPKRRARKPAVKHDDASATESKPAPAEKVAEDEPEIGNQE